MQLAFRKCMSKIIYFHLRLVVPFVYYPGFSRAIPESTITPATYKKIYI